MTHTCYNSLFCTFLCGKWGFGAITQTIGTQSCLQAIFANQVCVLFELPTFFLTPWGNRRLVLFIRLLFAGVGLIAISALPFWCCFRTCKFSSRSVRNSPCSCNPRLMKVGTYRCRCSLSCFQSSGFYHQWGSLQSCYRIRPYGLPFSVQSLC